MALHEESLKPLLIDFGALWFVGAGVLVTVAAQVTSSPAVLGILVLAFAILTCYLSVNGIAEAVVFPDLQRQSPAPFS
ncbi:hypothetical protein ACEXQD_13910 [Herbiconiux sp. P15]|uniref:hypothetical protein n=1 Tax=Herbiconiux liukaitaii TaxID=3342799 RepID=UPI0035B77E92